MTSQNRFRIARLTALAVALPTLSVTSVACDTSEEADDLEMRMLEARPERMPAPDPEPEPEPEPEPISAEELVGLSLEEAESMLAWTVVYEMERLPSGVLPYSGTEIEDTNTGWYAHAMQWKEYLTRSFNGSVVGPSVFGFDVSAADAAMNQNGAYHWGVSTQSPGLANTLEAGHPSHTSPVFNADPPGTWMSHSELDPAAGVVFAALVMHYWGSPVYLNGQYTHPSTSSAAGSIVRTIALQELEFLLGAPDLLSACGLPSNTSPSVALTTAPHCNHGAVLTDDIITTWNISTPWTTNYVAYDENTSFDPAVLAYAWTHAATNTQGNLVFDPPAEVDEGDVAGLAVIANAMVDQVLIADESGTLVRLTDYVAELEPQPAEG